MPKRESVGGSGVRKSGIVCGRDLGTKSKNQRGNFPLATQGDETMTFMEERIRSRIRQRIMRSKMDSLEPILIEEIGWEAYEWQRT